MGWPMKMETGFEEMEKQMGTLPKELESVSQARHEAISIHNYIGDPKTIRSWDELIWRVEKSLNSAKRSREIYEPMPKKRLSVLSLLRRTTA